MSTTSPEVSRLYPLADRVAQKFCARHPDGSFDPDDVRQDLLLDLMARLKSYDPTRGTLQAFAWVCFRHRTARLAAQACHRQEHRRTVSLDLPLNAVTSLTLSDTLAEDDSYGCWIGGEVDAAVKTERRLDLDRALSGLSAEARSFCAVLIASDRDPVAASGLPRTTFYRRIADLRCELLAAGIPERRILAVAGGR